MIYQARILLLRYNPQSLESQLLLLNPRQQPDQRDNGSHNNGPQFDMEVRDIGTRLRGRGHGREADDEQQISTRAVVFVNGLGIVHAPVDAGGVVLRYAHDGLDGKEDVGDEAEDAVGGGEVGGAVGEFVIFDDYECGEEGEDGGAVDDGVDVGAQVFLFRGVRWLEHEDGLGDQEQAGGVEQLCVAFSKVLLTALERGGLTGCAEKRDRGAIKMEAQIVAVSWKLVSVSQGLGEQKLWPTHDPDACLGDYSGPWRGTCQILP